MLIPGIFRYIMALSVWETADGRILCTGILPYRAVRHLPTHMLISKKENVMKKAIVLSLALTLALGMTGCAKTENAPAAESSVEAVSEASSEAAEETTTEAAEETSTAAAEEASKSEGVLNYEEYMAAELDSEVVVETYVQAKQSWWEDKATVYTQDQDGAYFVYNMACSEEDYEKLKPSRYGVNLETTEQKKAAVEEAIGDILPVKMQMSCLYSVPTQMLVHFMSMENMMFAMYDYPDLFKEMMGRIADDTLAYYKMLEEKRLILPTTTFEGVGQGTWSFTTELPGWDEWEKRPFTTKDVWGFMDSQETVGISPDMYEEFIFPCYEKIASSYGLLSYGCCEPVDPIWDKCLSRLTNLRKVSISPWCNEEFMGERLRGSKVIYHRKPSPNFLGVDPVLDEDAFRAHIRKSLTAARGCKMEITQRDVYTIHNNIPKARRYVALIREEIENNWKG